MRLCKSTPLKLLGPTPWKVFARLEMLGKIWQGACLALFIGEAGLSAAFSAMAAAPVPLWLAAAAFFAYGQALNVAMYTSIGDVGVYYGFKMGAKVPWCSGFPFNVGLRHPQVPC